MPFHVTITSSRDARFDGPLRAVDLSEDRLLEEFVELYRLGGSLTWRGRTVDPDDIVRVRVFRTEGSWTEWLDTHPSARPDWDEFLERGYEDVTRQYIDEQPDPQGTSNKGRRSARSRRRVLVIHGRNEKARQAMFTFLRALDVQPIEWEQAIADTRKGSPHTLEAVRATMDSAQAVVVLMTGEDEARLLAELGSTDEERALRPQPRPNVLLEAGMALATDPDRTILTQLGPLRPASDLDGLNYVRLSNAPASRSDLRRRLKNAGCAISDEAGPAWMSSDAGGDFEAAVVQRWTAASVSRPENGHAGPAQRPPPINRKGSWNEDVFLTALAERGGRDSVKVAQRVLNWAREQNLEVVWGRGRAEGSLAPSQNVGGVRYSLATIYTYARIEFNFQALRTRPPFDDADRRVDLLRRLNQVPGVELPPDSIDRRPSVVLADIASDQSLDALIQIWQDIVDELRTPA